MKGVREEGGQPLHIKGKFQLQETLRAGSSTQIEIFLQCSK